ncbi:MAG: hypothetical protein FD174_3678 [Geobacteraceae bacterium]|nr:MAG: hypothetical protein FD174_3678 [Geobacteraceae bacterium]
MPVWRRLTWPYSRSLSEASATRLLLRLKASASKDGCSTAPRRILPEGWVAYTTTPAPQAPEKEYGAHFWLKIPKESRSGDHEKLVPADAFHAVGHEGQFISIIPSRDLVIVRLGLTRFPSAWRHDKFIDLVLRGIEQ